MIYQKTYYLLHNIDSSPEWLSAKQRGGVHSTIHKVVTYQHHVALALRRLSRYGLLCQQSQMDLLHPIEFLLFCPTKEPQSFSPQCPPDFCPKSFQLKKTQARYLIGHQGLNLETQGLGDQTQEPRVQIQDPVINPSSFKLLKLAVLKNHCNQ